MPDNQIRLLIVDDHQVVRLGLKSLFATVPTISVVGEARDASEAIRQAHRLAPDVVLMDVRLPDFSGVDACRQIRSERPETRVIMLTSYADEDAIVASIMAGASGYLLKESEPERLIESVEMAAHGSSLLDPAITETVLGWMRRAATATANDPLGDLSEQERSIVPLVAEGKTNREIAETLHLSEHTVKTYMSHILRKLQFRRRAEIAAFLSRLRSTGYV